MLYALSDERNSVVFVGHTVRAWTTKSNRAKTDPDRTFRILCVVEPTEVWTTLRRVRRAYGVEDVTGVPRTGFVAARIEEAFT